MSLGLFCLFDLNKLRFQINFNFIWLCSYLFVLVWKFVSLNRFRIDGISLSLNNLKPSLIITWSLIVFGFQYFYHILELRMPILVFVKLANNLRKVVQFVFFNEIDSRRYSLIPCNSNCFIFVQGIWKE